MSQDIGERVIVGAVTFTVTDRRSTSGSGSKFYGKFIYTLVNGEGEKFSVYGKRVAWDSRLTRLNG